jgi:aromatic-L-amino-acid decarboxylase
VIAMPLLNLDDTQIRHAGTYLLELLQRLEHSSSERRVVPPADRSALSTLRSQPFPTQGVGIDGLFSEISNIVIPNSTNTAHPRFLAYVLGPSNGVAPFAEAIAAALNQNCNFWQLSPAANAIEQNVVSWLASLFNYPATAGGLMTSGGSVATLTALSAAMHARVSGLRRTGLQRRSSPLVLYTSAEAHRCVEKNAAILGLGTDNLRKIPVDPAFRMHLDRLSDAVDADRRGGKEPFCVVATAGTVNTGAIDPIAALADFCAHHRLWLHVDAAYGGFFVLSNRIRDQLLACARADSIALDPHKLLFAPLEAGALLVRDRRTLERAFRFDATYLQADDDPLLTNFMDYGIELSRGFKAFKIWCALRTFGITAFVEAIDHALDMARYFEGQLLESAVLDVVTPVTLNAVCFRVKDRDDAFQQAAIDTLREEGTALVGPVRLAGRAAIRVCVTNFRTRRSDIDAIVERLVALGTS